MFLLHFEVGKKHFHTCMYDEGTNGRFFSSSLIWQVIWMAWALQLSENEPMFCEKTYLIQQSCVQYVVVGLYPYSLSEFPSDGYIRGKRINKSLPTSGIGFSLGPGSNQRTLVHSLYFYWKCNYDPLCLYGGRSYKYIFYKYVNYAEIWIGFGSYIPTDVKKLWDVDKMLLW